MSRSWPESLLWFSIVRRIGRNAFSWVLLVAILQAISSLGAFTIQHEKVGETSFFTLFIPFESLHFQLQDSIYVSKTEVTLNLVNEAEKNFYHELSTFEITSDDLNRIHSRSLQMHFSTKAISGNISAFLKVKNVLQGTLQQELFTFEPPYENRMQTSPLILFRKSGYEFVTQFPFDGALADSVSITQHFNLPPDSLQVVVNDRVLWKWDTPGPNLDVTLPMENCVYHGINVRTFFGNRTISVDEQRPYSSPYEERYPPKIQIRQMEIIMLSADIQQARMIRKGELAEYIEQYWKRNDPTPETEYNENREYFIHRVMEADRRFGLKGFMDGWRTDQGKILIKYGEPEEVYKESFPIGTYPYIIWYYYSIDKQFIFYDKKGFGYYELEEKWYIDRY